MKEENNIEKKEVIYIDKALKEEKVKYSREYEPDEETKN